MNVLEVLVRDLPPRLRELSITQGTSTIQTKPYAFKFRHAGRKKIVSITSCVMAPTPVALDVNRARGPQDIHFAARLRRLIAVKLNRLPREKPV